MKIRKISIKAIAFVLIVALCSVYSPLALAVGENTEYLIPGGNTVGIEIESQGVIVTNVVGIETEKGSASPAADAGVLPGDIIIGIGKNKIASGEDLQTAMGDVKGEKTSITVLRNGIEKQFTIMPYENDAGCGEIGVWVRDSLAGLGTITFFNEKNGSFGALGHGVNDLDTDILFPVRCGNIMKAHITEVIKGERGMPGQLHGVPDGETVLGRVEKNTSGGIFGKAERSIIPSGAKALPVADSGSVETGDAVILSNIEGDEVKEYSVEITRVYSGAGAGDRNMMLRVTDDELLEKTGGIVQGMSGSPIIQNGKIIGAVTHVLINDSSRGYGIFIENMLDAA